MVIGTAGHIDHGKSALVKALTGIDPDRLKEEQARGITIDLGFASATIGGVPVAFVDVPGHERFVRHMLAGAGGIDAVLLVIAADESVMPQTREHFEICRLLGVGRGLIVLTKADLADRDTREIAALESRELVRGSFLADAPILPVSARTGEGLEALGAAIAALGGAPPRQGRSGLPRLPVDRVFTMKGFGAVVTGTLVSGRVSEGDDLVVLPGHAVVRVRGVQLHNRRVPSVEAPSRAALNLGGVAAGDLARGLTLARSGGLPVTGAADARLEILSDARPLRHGARVRVHQGTSELAARVAVCAVRPTRAAPWRQPPPGEAGVRVPAGGEAYVRLRFERPAVLTRDDRFVVRAYSPPRTIGGGVILDPTPRPTGLRRAAALARFERIESTGEAGSADDPVLAVWVAEAGGRGLDEIALVARSGAAPAAVAAGVERLQEAGRAVRLHGRVYDAGAIPALAGRIRATLAAHHARHPADPGMPREAVRDQSAHDTTAEVFDAAVSALQTAGEIRGVDRISLASHEPARSAAEAGLLGAIERLVHDAGLTPPDAAGLARAIPAAEGDVTRALHVLVRERRLVRVDVLVCHPEPLARLREDVKGMKEGRAPGSGPATVDVASFKARYGLSRKFAIPLLEWLDRERVTRRVGDARVVI